MEAVKKLALVLIVLVAAIRTDAQGLNSDGKDFYVGFIYPSYNSNASRSDVLGFFGCYVLVSSYNDGVATISYFDAKGNETNVQSYKIFAHRTIQIPVNRAIMRMTDPGGIAEFKAMHITSTVPINVQYYSTGANSGGSYLAIPTSALGQQYVVETYHDNPGGAGGILSHESSAGGVLIIAPFDGTNVVITPTSTTLPPPGQSGYPGAFCGPNSTDGIAVPIMVSLRRGQCYMLKSNATSATCDLSGTSIVSDRPIAVIASHEDALIDGSTVGDHPLLDARDFMIEQMLPVEYWDTTGYLTIPMIDSKGSPGGLGDEIRMFYDQGVYSMINNTGATIAKDPPGSILPSSHIPGDTIVVPTHYFSTNGKKFHVAQYDRRSEGTSAPFTAPSQMTIIPKSCWKSSYLWYVPSNLFQTLQVYYITMICRTADFTNDSILLSVDGGKPASIRTALAVQKTFTIPDYPGYSGIILKLNSASYYATNIAKGPQNKGGVPFIMYNYGFRGIDPDRDIGDNDEDDCFFSYANPVGFAAKTGEPTQFTVTADTLCGRWNVCIDLSSKHHAGIKSMILLQDSAGDFVKPGHQAVNVAFDSKDDPEGLGEVLLNDLDSHRCIIVNVKDIFTDAYAPLYILDNHGNGYLVELRYNAPQVVRTITPAGYGNITGDTIHFPLTALGEQECVTYVIRNAGSAVNGDPSIQISNVRLDSASTYFTITGQTPQTPVSLAAGDSMVLTLCFIAQDTDIHTNKLIVETPCSDAPVNLVAQAGTGIITATDFDFGASVLGSVNCDQRVTISNIGNYPFVLNYADWPATSAFKPSAGSLARLPVVLYPPNDPAHRHRDTIQIVCCFTPALLGEDSVLIHWITDIKQPFTSQIKSYSTLRGRGIKPALQWDKEQKSDTITKQTSIIGRVYLINAALKPITVKNVFFAGPDEVEYQIYANQFNYQPLDDFPMNPGDTLWVEYKWQPDVTRLIGRNPRSVSLIATTNSITGELDSAVINITGIFADTTSTVMIEQISEGEIQASIRGNLIHLEPMELSSVRSIVLYDLLGRAITQWPLSGFIANKEGIDLTLPTVSSGAYFIHIEGDKVNSNVPIQIR